MLGSSLAAKTLKGLRVRDHRTQVGQELLVSSTKNENDRVESVLSVKLFRFQQVTENELEQWTMWTKTES
jgi:hypothetical protein